jgi:hypothetical protein
LHSLHLAGLTGAQEQREWLERIAAHFFQAQGWYGNGNAWSGGFSPSA